MIGRSFKSKIIFPVVFVLFFLVVIMTVYASFVYCGIFEMMPEGLSVDELLLERNRIIFNNAFIGLAGLIISYFMLAHIISGITKPINKLACLVSNAAQGHYDAEVKSAENKSDEITQLSANVFSLVEKLRESANKAQMESVAKSTFLANMSHEIRTPMNSIMGFSELALDDDLPAKTREYLGKILENTEGLLQIINDILDISKVESGKMELEKIAFNMHELFTSCRTLILPKAVEKGIMVYFFAEPSIGKMLIGDPTRLRQVLVNLLSNAVKFTNTGTVNLQTDIKEKNENTITMLFEVKDTGVGMSSEQIEKIFDPFIQAESGTARKYGGTGLGLSITRNILELMGSRLYVESTPGLGSRFYFTIKLETVDVPENDLYLKKVLLNEINKPVFNGEVLLCEDNPMNQQVICEHLARVGLKTTVAWNGRVGLDMVKRRVLGDNKQFALIFMDIHMPVMDGIEATKKIREIDKNVPIIAMTANVMSDDRRNYLASGMQDCVCKPFTSQELWHCLLKYFKPLNFDDLKKKLNNETQIEFSGLYETESEYPKTPEPLPNQANNVKDNENILLEADMEFQKALRGYFVKTNKNVINNIINNLNSGDIKTAHRITHSLKSNAAQLGKTSLQKAAAEVEHLLKDGKNSVSDEQLKKLETELNAVLAELGTVVDSET